MSHIYIYSPSSAVRDKAAFRLGIKRLRALGHAVEIDADALSSHQRFAGDDASRLAAIARAAASGADLAMISRGGYGLTRILANLPYTALAKAIESGTQFVGLSDFTALQLGLMSKTGAITWQGPCVLDDFGTEAEPDDLATHTENTQEHFVAFLQWLDADRAGLPAAYRERLQQALARFGVPGLERSPALESALMWLFRSFARVDRAAVWLLAPYAAWVTFAGYLNASVWWLNRQ